jgi:tetratricopeptide (TPR) repeat protein
MKTMKATPHIQPDPSPARRSARSILLAVLSLALIGIVPPRSTCALSDLERGAKAPDFTTRSIDGKLVNTAETRGRILVLLFGEVNQHRSEEAYTQVRDVLSRLGPEIGDVEWIYVLSKHSAVAELDTKYRAGENAPTIVHDSDRGIFGGYGIIAMPAVIVIDAKGRVAHTIASLNPRFDQILRNALRLAAGEISAEQFDRMLEHPDGGEEDTARDHARRLTRLGRYLYYEGMTESAEEKYTEALDALPGYLPARLALGELLLRTDRVHEAEAVFRSAWGAHPDSTDAALGLAEAWIAQGDEFIAEAERLLQAVEDRGPPSPRWHYLMGTIHERRGKMDLAAQSFKEAATALLREAERNRALREGMLRN